MSGRLIIVSNRLPYSFTLKNDKSCMDAEDEELPSIKDNDPYFELSQSDGGLVSGLKPLAEKEDTIWLGWADTTDLDLNDEEIGVLKKELREEGCVPVFLNQQEVTDYYDGFSNSAIWPLFHYFAQYCRFEQEKWESYIHVNEKFCDVIAEVAEPDDTIWIQDYHLLLLPKMVREKIPEVSIGFFLHIPFPSHEMFRILPCRDEILEGMLGADLIGFHTYDYTRHFLSSCRRILGLENQYGTFTYEGRLVQTDAFPLGIDYELFAKAGEDEKIKKKAEEYISENVNGDGKVILSIERLDYTKGILASLDAYDAFLEKYPEWKERIIFTLVVVPSRENVGSYQKLKRQVDEKVGAIEGKHSTSKWSPVDYYYRSFPFDELCSIYLASNVMLVTPLRDGMNLISKEYLAVHDDKPGVLILSEMAGSVYELGDALIINPFNQTEYIDTMEEALIMPEHEQTLGNQIMQKRLKQYTSKEWAMSFMNTLRDGISQQEAIKTRVLTTDNAVKLCDEFKDAEKRAIILDYDGTLVGFKKDPKDAYPDEELLEILTKLSENRRNECVIISGRDRETMDKWFGGILIDMVAEHGIWNYSHETKNWIINEPLDEGWKNSIRSELEQFVIRTPGSFIEEKDYSLVWHCRKVSEELGERRMSEIKKALSLEAESKGLMILQGNKVVEIKPQSINKGRAAYSWLQEKQCDFSLCAGDDTTDEDMFRTMPDETWTIKVGVGTTEAKYNLRSYKDMRALLKKMAQ